MLLCCADYYPSILLQKTLLLSVARCSLPSVCACIVVGLEQALGAAKKRLGACQALHGTSHDGKPGPHSTARGAVRTEYLALTCTWGLHTTVVFLFVPLAGF
jgi:hypothetical protein